MKEVAFLGGKSVGAICLENLLNRQSELGFAVTAILPTPRGEQVTMLANSFGVPLVGSLASLPECDLIISVQYHEILKSADIRKAREIAVNLHMAPLPEYRGCNQFSLSIINGDREFGVTLHQLTEGIDSGPIISEKRFPISDHVWVEDLVELATNKSFELFRDSLKSLVNGTYSLLEQSDLIPIRGTSLNYREGVTGLKKLSLDWDADTLDRYIRALSMPGHEPPYALLKSGRKIYFQRSDPDD